MTTEFTEENFEILFNEEQKIVEIRFQGINALALATLSARVDDLEAQVGTQVDGLQGSVTTVSLGLQSMEALLTSLTNDLSAEYLARIAADELSTTELNNLNISLTAAIQAEANTRAAALLAEAEARGAAIMSATGTIVTDLAALATTVEGLATSMGGAEASIIAVQDALSTETTARAAQYSAIQASFNNMNAAILSESLARSDSVSALASQIEAISVNTGTTVFMQDDEPTTGMIAGDIWYDTNDGNKPYRYSGSAWVDTTDVRITQNAAAIITEQTARINEDGVLASSIQTLTATVNDVSASVTTEQNARIAADGTINSRYSVKVDANGHVAGFGLIATNNAYGNAGDSEFVVNATRFKVYNGSSAVSPFVVTGGVVYMQNVVIQNAQIASLEAGKITTGTLSANISGGTAGVIRFNQTAYDTGTGYWLGYATGVVKFSLGVGGGGKALLWDGTNLTLRNADLTLAASTGYTRYLGTDVASTYIDWYGTGTVNDDNAKFYIKKDGNAFFGGELRSIFAPRAWCRFYGSTTAYVTRQYNIGSVTKVGTGIYQFTFATPLANRLYVVLCNATRYGQEDNPLIPGPYDFQTTGFKIRLKSADGTPRDVALGGVIVFGADGADEIVTDPPETNDPRPPGDNEWPPGAEIP